jgi:hypothetical protein
MSYIVKQKSGKYTYLFECTAFRNEKGRPDNRKTPIGRLDPQTGEPVYKQEYLERMKSAGAPVKISPLQKVFSVADIKKSSIREYGMFHLLCRLAEKSGLSDSLAASLPTQWQKVFTLACFLVSTEDPFLHCEEWLMRTESLPVGNMSSQRVSELLAAIGPDERERFYTAWCTHRREKKYLALDITSVSSYSELIEDIEWGYNRDHDNLPQVNICMLMGEDSRLPIYQTVYSGSLKDVSTLKTTLSKFDSVTGEHPVLVVMDKGFFSKNNVHTMLIDEKIKKFIISVPFTSTFAKRQVGSERKDIDSAKNTIVVGGDSMRAVTKINFLDGGDKVYTHIFYGAAKAARKKEELYAHIAVLRDEADASPEKCLQSSGHTKWLAIRKSCRADTGYTVNIRDAVVEKALSIAGWVVIISNDVEDAKKAMRIYRAKDVVEKGFLRLKRSLDLGRLRVHSQENMQNKVFIGFIALVMLSEIHTIMSDKEIYRKMGMKQLIRALGKHRVQEIGETRIIFPETKEQRQIYEAFGVDVPV